jgi:hypothetical protein
MIRVFCPVLVFACGCGGPGLYSVKGMVVYKDGSGIAVLERGQIVFDPADPSAPKASARGEIRKDGSFTMSTYKEGDGVVPGAYRIMVVPPPYFGIRGSSPPELFDSRYEDFETSGLSITVTGPVDDFVVTVEKP